MNVFLVSLLAQGGFATLEDSAGVINRSKSKSAYRAFHFTALETALKAIHGFSFSWRWLLWSPVPGMALLFCATRIAWKSRDTAVLAITGSMILQLGGIFMLSIASEYRYLLPFFVLPMVLVPVLLATHPKPVTAS